jgi:fucose permease
VLLDSVVEKPVSWWFDLGVVSAFLYLGGYAVTGMLALLYARVKEQGMPDQAARDLSVVYLGSVSGFILLVAHAIWDMFQAEHFPVLITYSVLLLILLLVGRASYRLYNSRQDWMR